MSSNSLTDLLVRLEQGNVMSGWGAILAFSRAELNRLIKEQYIQGLGGLRFLLPFSDTFPVGDIGDNSEHVELRSIVLGVPTLSFESASLNKAVLTLTMNIVGGTYTHSRRAAGVPPTVLSSFSISEGMGFNVSMRANVDDVIGEVDSGGIVTLDLALSSEVTCNLGSVKNVQEQIGEYFQRHFVGQADLQRRFVLGRLELDKYNPLSPTSFAIRVQRAPGADNRLAANYGDGAVVVFIRLSIQDGEAMPGTPIENSGFPYLIPDDQSGGLPLYSATLMIDQRLRHLVDEEQLDLLKSLIFPNQNHFDELSRHEPHDLAIFGNIRESTTAVSIQPSAVMLSAGQEQAFVAVRNDGSVIADAQWTVKSPDFPGSLGRITSNGVYTANSQSTMYRNRLPIVVTASYAEGAEERKVSALVHERFERVTVAPLVQIKGGADQTATAIRATSVGSEQLFFSIMEPTAGARLERISENLANYFPPPEVQPEAILVQRIQISDVENRPLAVATIVLVNRPIYLELGPYYVEGLLPLGTAEFKELNGIEPTLLRWSVLGEGEIDESGIFTAPATPMSMISVVVCELPSPGEGWPAQYGYSIVNMQPVEVEYIPPRWQELAEFSISAPNTLPGGLVQVYANGFQQVPIFITLETNTIEVDGQQLHVPVSDVELSTLRLVEKYSDGQVRFIDDLQEGIEYGSQVPYAAHTRSNRFSLYSPTLAGENARRGLPAPKNNGTRYRELYVHMAVEGGQTFYAEFKADDGTTWRSNDSNSEGSPEVTVHGVKPPVLNAAHYQLVRDRVFNGEGHDGIDDPAKPDPFSYYLDSIDYWHLSYMRLGSYPVKFATLMVEGNISTIQWESEYLEETFFSYTGYAFYPAHYRGIGNPPDKLSFDVYYRALLQTLSRNDVDREFIPGKEPSPGELIISLHRVPDMPYWHDGMAEGEKLKMYRSKLDRPVIFVLLDEEGNRHRVQIGFEPPTVDDSRNSLTLNLQ